MHLINVLLNFLHIVQGTSDFSHCNSRCFTVRQTFAKTKHNLEVLSGSKKIRSDFCYWTVLWVSLLIKMEYLKVDRQILNLKTKSFKSTAYHYKFIYYNLVFLLLRILLLFFRRTTVKLILMSVILI